MSNRSERASIAKDIIRILDEGIYHNLKGKLIDIKEELNDSIKNTVVYDPNSFQEVINNREQIFKERDFTYETMITVKNETTLMAAKRLVEEEKYTKVICLNFASAKNPGGGFLKGSRAQEESLDRASGLYVCLNQYTL